MQPPPAQQQSSQFGGRITTGPPPQHFNNQPPPPNFNNAYPSGAQSAAAAAAVAAAAAAAGQPPPPPPPPSHSSGPNGGQEQRSFSGPNSYTYYGHSNSRYAGDHGGSHGGPQSGGPSGPGGSGGRNEGKPNHVLLITVINPAYPINCDVIHQICSPQGKVLRIVIFKKNGVQAMVEFDSVDSAKRAKLALNGCDIYSGCCTLKVEFAKVSTFGFVVLFNFHSID